jgi:hypothetical protein
MCGFCEAEYAGLNQVQLSDIGLKQRTLTLLSLQFPQPFLDFA